MAKSNGDCRYALKLKSFSCQLRTLFDNAFILLTYTFPFLLLYSPRAAPGAEIVCNSPISMSIRTFLSLFAGEHLEADSIQIVPIDTGTVSRFTSQEDVNTAAARGANR